MKKINALLVTGIIGMIFFMMIFNVPQKVYIDKSLNCFDRNSQDTVTVNISGILYSYALRGDLFTGTIEVRGKRTSKGTFVMPIQRKMRNIGCKKFLTGWQKQKLVSWKF